MSCCVPVAAVTFGCRLQKKRIECAIMIQAELEQAGIDGSIPVALG